MGREVAPESESVISINGPKPPVKSKTLSMEGVNSRQPNFLILQNHFPRIVHQPDFMFNCLPRGNTCS